MTPKDEYDADALLDHIDTLTEAICEVLGYIGTSMFPANYDYIRSLLETALDEVWEDRDTLRDAPDLP
jgi:hypothetical protein